MMNMSAYSLYWVDPITETVRPCTRHTPPEAIKWSVLVEARSCKTALRKAREWYGIDAMAASRQEGQYGS